MWIYAIGFLAQIFFSLRILIQWFLSEKAKKVESPILYWVFSVTGAYLLFIYGWFRSDFAIMLGQVISYYIYMWNLQEKKVWTSKLQILRWLLIITPIIGFAWIGVAETDSISNLFHNKDIPMWLLIYGSMGQVVFTLRFIYQWVYSYHRHESILPIGFWIISIIGSVIIITYGMYRLDPVLIVGQSVGLVAYVRNIMIGNHAKKMEIIK